MKIVLLQLPIPQHNFFRQTGNIPLGGACLKQAVSNVSGLEIEIIPESQVSYLGDAALEDLVLHKQADMVGFTVYSWNLERTLYLIDRLKQRSAGRIIVGGPEITPDNQLLEGHGLDFCCFGEGEQYFRTIIADIPGVTIRNGSSSHFTSFPHTGSPYLGGELEPWIERMMVLETMRGCPYKCAYCYYNKSRSSRDFLPQSAVLDAVRWAVSNGIPEIFLLDPSLEVRSDLVELLQKIAKITHHGRLNFQSEIRAEAVDARLAAAFCDAGFVEFEIGLQSTDQDVLKGVHRKTDLRRFVQGVHNLHHYGIRTKIDLILGLPGDSKVGFFRSVDFLVEHDIAQDVSIFPMSILPGTELRTRSNEYGLHYQSRPPYTVIETPTFTSHEMLEAFCYAEERFEIVLQPEPDLDLSYRGPEGADIVSVSWLESLFSDKPVISKIILSDRRGGFEATSWSRRLSQPYQVFVFSRPESGRAIKKALADMTAHNPWTPLEVIFFDWDRLEDIELIERSLCLERPQYLDLDLPFWGSRSVLLTLVSDRKTPIFGGTMKRQVYWWRHDRLPNGSDLTELQHLDGLLIDTGDTDTCLRDWQDLFADQSSDYMPISFASIRHQQRWMQRVSPDEYWFGTK